VTLPKVGAPPLVIPDAQTVVTLDDDSFALIPPSAFASSTTVPTELPAGLTVDANAPYAGLYYSNTGSRTAYLQDLGTTSGAITVQAAFVAADAALTSAAVGALTTTQTAGSSYTSNEQAMLNAAKADLASIRTVVNQLVTDITSLRTAFNAELAALQVTGGPQKSS